MADEKRKKPRPSRAARPKMTVDALLGRDNLMSTLVEARDMLPGAADVAIVVLSLSGTVMVVSSCDSDIETLGLLAAGQLRVNESE